MSKNIQLLLTVCLCLKVGFFIFLSEGVANIIPLTNQETLAYMIKKSDVIAVLSITGGTNQKRIFSFSEMPQHVEAKLLRIIKGKENKEIIIILNSPKYQPTNNMSSTIVLRNGYHLAFLSRDGHAYRPTIGFSLLDIYNGKVHPIWNQTKNGNGVTSGRLLDLVISEIEMEIEFAE